MSPQRGFEEDALTITTEVPVVQPKGGQRTVEHADASREAGLIGRVRSGGLDLRNTWQVVVGALLLPLGVAVILLGWSGAAHGRVDQQQIPYLISGGVLGLAAVIVGCFFYWAHWLYRIYDQADVHHQEAMREQADLMRALLEVLASRPGEASGTASAGGAAANGSANGMSRGYVATPAGTNFHTPSCPIVANRQQSLRSVSVAEAEEMRPCRICEPLDGQTEE